MNSSFNILAIDLANFSSSVALLKQGQLVYSDHSDVFRGQDVTLLPKLKALLKEHGLRFQDLDRFVSTTGPGSFTGIRVALATLQGLSFAARVPALGVTSFQWVARTYPKSLHRKTLVLLESMRLELYGQLFDETGQEVGTPFSLPPKVIAQNPHYQGALCIGNGAKYMTEYGFDVDEFMPQASHLGTLALKIPESDFMNYPCVPVYTREADTSKPKNA